MRIPPQEHISNCHINNYTINGLVMFVVGLGGFWFLFEWQFSMICLDVIFGLFLFDFMVCLDLRFAIERVMV